MGNSVDDRNSSNYSSKTGEKDFFSLKKTQETKAKEELEILTPNEAMEKELFQILTEIDRLKGHQTKTAEVKNLKELIKKLKNKIKQYLEVGPNNEVTNPQQRQQQGGPAVEENPLVPAQGGMAIKEVSAEWSNMQEELGAEAQTLDNAELENKLKAKLKQRMELSNKAKNELKFKNVNKLLVKFEQTLKEKPVIKEVLKIEEPRLAPKAAPRFTPPGMS